MKNIVAHHYSSLPGLCFNNGLTFLSSLITRMLQRDPKRRASLEEIENHPWLQGVDPSPATKYNIPLVSYKNLSEEEHNSIIQRMVLGDIADRDAIVEYVGAHQHRAEGLGLLGWALYFIK